MNEVINTSKELENIENEIAFNIPELKDLTADQLKKIAELVVLEKYKDEMKKDVELKQYDYNSMKQLFLDNITNSENTKEAYIYCLADFESYIETLPNKNPLAINAQIADDYIYNLLKQNKANTTVRRSVACLSSFFSFAERRSNGIIKNVFKGTKARPKAITKNENKFYSFGVDNGTIENLTNDFQQIINNIDNTELKAIISIGLNCGLRVGAFSGLSIHSGKYKTVSKGSEISGIIPADCLKYIDSLGIKHNKPFERYTDKRLKNLFKYHTNKLYKSGVISNNYSFHDIRHYFAIKDYLEHKDIYSLSKKLHHSSIAITEQYLKGLKVIA